LCDDRIMSPHRRRGTPLVALERTAAEPERSFIMGGWYQYHDAPFFYDLHRSTNLHAGVLAWMQGLPAAVSVRGVILSLIKIVAAPAWP
jgi:hypothetical protein